LEAWRYEMNRRKKLSAAARKRALARIKKMRGSMKGSGVLDILLAERRREALHNEAKLAKFFGDKPNR